MENNNNFDPNGIIKNPNPDQGNAAPNNSVPTNNSSNQNVQSDIQFFEQASTSQLISEQKNEVQPSEYSDQIQQWLKEGTITKEQADKMQASATIEKTKARSNKLIYIISTIGAILIFLGFAWLLAMNWHQIPSLLKILILLGSTLSAFFAGVWSKQKGREGVGRALIALGSLLYILSVFLIAQIFATSTSLQGTVWLLFLCWPVILLTAYFLNSRENLFIGLVVFFLWALTQYFASIMDIYREETAIFGIVMILMSAGALLFGISAFHRYLNHRFATIYKFWTIFYFLSIFFILSFQFVLPILSEYSSGGGVFSGFLVFFMIICSLVFIVGIVFEVRSNSQAFGEILGFVGILTISLVMILSTKIGSGLMGTCYPRNCFNFRNSTDCLAAPSILSCEWANGQGRQQGYCRELQCYNYQTSESCTSSKLGCIWSNTFCMPKNDSLSFDLANDKYKLCSVYNNQKGKCISNSLCNWKPTISLWDIQLGLPTSLWLLWIVNNIIAIGFILLILWYGQKTGSVNIVNVAMAAFVGIIISRYIGFMIDLKGYFLFSILAIFGGILLIAAAWLIPKWRKRILNKI